MFRLSTDTRVRLARTAACIVTLTALSVLALATATIAPAAPPWRAFAPNSPWNVPAAPESIAPNNPYAGQFGSGQMALSGTPDNPTYSSQTYFAQPGAPPAPINLGQPGWAPQDNIKCPEPVPELGETRGILKGKALPKLRSREQGDIWSYTAYVRMR